MSLLNSAPAPRAIGKGTKGDLPNESRAKADLERERATIATIESTWSCQVRSLAALAPMRAIAVNDCMRAVLLVEDRGVESTTHSWIDVALPRFVNSRRLATDFAVPCIIVARFNDAVLFDDLRKVGPQLVLCGQDGQARVRLEVKRMAPVRFESRW